MCSLTRCARSRDHPSPDHPSPDLPFLQFLNRRPVGRKSLLCSLTRCARSRDALAHATIRPRTIRPRTYPSCNPRLMAGIPFPPEPPNITDFDCQISPGVFHLSGGARCPAHGLPFLSGTEINTQRNRQRVEHQHGAQKDNSGAIQRGFGSIRNLCGHCVQVH